MAGCIKEALEKDDIFVINLKEEIPERRLGIITHSHAPSPQLLKGLLSFWRYLNKNLYGLSLQKHEYCLGFYIY